MSTEPPPVNLEEAERKISKFWSDIKELGELRRGLETSATQKRAELKEEMGKPKDTQDENKIKGLQNEILKITENLDFLKRMADERGIRLSSGEVSLSLTKLLSSAGFAFILLSIGLLVYSAYVLSHLDQTPQLPEGITSTAAIVVAYLTIYFKPILIILSAMIASGI